MQASSRAWGGGPDLGMNEVDGELVVARTLRRVRAAFPDAEICLVAPSFDAGGPLEKVLRDTIGTSNVRTVFGFDDSPLDRLLGATAGLPDDAHFIRLDGQHFCVDLDASRAMLALARAERLDCVKFPDDFPSRYQSEVYRVGALRAIAPMLTGDLRPFRVHPKFFLTSRKDQFRSRYHTPAPYPRSRFQEDREFARRMYRIDQIEINSKRLWTGDQLTFHYELAAQRLRGTDVVLDVACGDGFGLTLLAERAARVVGMDIDEAKVEAARARYKDNPKISCEVGDITAMPLPDGSFDVVTSFETLEHVDADAYFRECARVLKPGGRLILSTPQNSVGEVPVTPFHVHEYSLENLLDWCRKRFDVVEVMGIKAGRIIIEGDPRGANSVIVCRKAA